MSELDEPQPTYSTPHVDDVFVTSGEPQYTYVTRDDGVDAQVTRLLRAKQKIVAISGPSKAGKTVLVRRVSRTLDLQILDVSGNDMNSIDDFWLSLAAQTGAVTERESSVQTGTSATNTFEASVSGPLASIKGSVSDGLQDSTSARRLTAVNLPQAVREKLAAKPYCIIIDDFHYAPEGVRRQLARALKEIIALRIPIVMVAVPHRVLDLVHEENELHMRVVRLRVHHWAPLELARIAMLGFDALHVQDNAGRLAASLAQNSVGSPLLMQELCGALCHENGVVHAPDLPAGLQPPNSWSHFFGSIAENAEHPLARALLGGPTQRRPRGSRQLRGLDTKVDNYGAVLLALHRISPVTEITEVDLRSAANEVLEERIPLDRVRWVCRKMHELAAQQRGEGDPAVEFVESPPTRLVIADPYLTFYIRWGLRSLGLPVFSPM